MPFSWAPDCAEGVAFADGFYPSSAAVLAHFGERGFSLEGTESLFVFKTRRYGDQPLAVRGRGAGADITASGVLADILAIHPARAAAVLQGRRA